MSDAMQMIRNRGITTELYDRLLVLLDQVGPFEIEVKKTSLHVVKGKAFLGVHPRATGLELNIVTSHPLTSSRIKKTEQVSAHRWHNALLVTDADQLDAEVGAWIHEAYDR